MKKSIKVRVICLVLALTILGGALTAAAIMGSPYETLRTAVLDAFVMRNVTVDMNMNIRINGETVHESNLKIIQGDDRALSVESAISGGVVISDGFVFVTPNMELTPLWMGLNESENGERWYRAQVFDPNHSFRAFHGNPFGMLTPEDRNSSEMRFAELLIDLVVGDMRNNISMTSENGVRRIRGSISEHQVPEIVRAGIDMFMERTHHNTVATRTELLNASGTEMISEIIFVDYRQGLTTVTTLTSPVTLTTAVTEENVTADMVTFNSVHGLRAVEVSDNEDVWIGETFYINGDVFVATGVGRRSESTRPFAPSDFDGVDPLEIPMQSLVINRVSGEATVDNDGNLLTLDASGLFTATNILGQANEIEINVSLQFSDIGTSSPSSPIPGAEEILALNNLRMPGVLSSTFPNRSFVFFTLNEDGSINEESITTIHPITPPRGTFRHNGLAEPESEIIVERYRLIEELEAERERLEESEISDESIYDISDDVYEYETDENDIDDEG